MAGAMTFGGRRLAMGAVLAILVGSGCAQEVGLIDRTQPGLLSKTLFEGEWFLKRTVIDVPYDAGYTFIGEQDEAQRIRWELQEKQLIAWRTTEHIVGTPDAAPVAVFAVEAHVDVQRDYLPQTGEETNLLVENMVDRPWYERAWVRVDWSRNLVTSFHFHVEGLDQDPVAYHVEDPRDPHALLVGRQLEDGSWEDTQDPFEQRDLETADYLDVVTRLFVKPETTAYEDWDGSVYVEPACWYWGNVDCGPAVVTVRNSFLRVDKAVSDYEPLLYPDTAAVRDEDGVPVRVKWNADGDLEKVEVDTTGEGGDGEGGDGPGGEASVDPLPTNPQDVTASNLARLPMFDKFGFFRVERFGWDPLYGETESDRVFLANRWNLWAKSHGDDGEPLPYAERGFRPVVYYLSPGFPEYLRQAAQQTIDQWDAIFREVVGELSGQEPPRMFELRDNTYAVDEATGEVLERGQPLGDLRYSHLWLVREPTRAGLLGYGPAAIDPLTGEIFQADALVYEGPTLEYAGESRDMVELMNGTLDPDIVAAGEHVISYVTGLAEGQFGGGAPPSKAEVAAFGAAHGGAGPPGGPQAAKPHAHGAGPRPVPKGAEKLRRPHGWASARMGHVHGTGMEALLMSDPALAAMKGAPYGLAPGDAGGLDPAGLPAGLRDQLSPVHWASPEHRRASLDRVRRMAEANIMMPTFVDDAVAGLAVQWKDLPSEEVAKRIATMVFKAAAEHEVGHTIGLRHNFEASTDALNYHPEYWALRGEDLEPLAPLTEPEVAGRVREYQYASIMDYGSRFNTDVQGLAPYDRAAIAFGYGGLVEVFDEAPNEPLVAVREAGEGVYERPLGLADALDRFRHYTSFPDVFGGVDAMQARSWAPYTKADAEKMGEAGGVSLEAQLSGDAPWTLWEVPYRFCSDEYVGGTATCHMFDTGADSYEIVRDAITRYRSYYWFNNFKRDRVAFSEWDYMDSMWWRYFSFVKNAYDNWVVGQWYDASEWEFLRGEADSNGIEDAPWEAAADGGLMLTAAAREGVAWLTEVLATPAPGAYWRDFGEGYWWAFSQSEAQQCTEGWAADATDWCADANLGLGHARWFENIYDWESGYYFYERLRWVGSFYDKLLALETLTSPDTYFLGIDTSATMDQWAISMYSAFPEEIQTVLAGVASDRFDLFGGTFDEAGEFVAPDPFDPATRALVEARDPVDPSTSFTVQLYALWYGMAWLNANFDTTFNDTAKVWLEGSGEALTPADESLLVRFDNPFNNRVYVATRSPDPDVRGVGATLLDRANALKADYETAAADTTTTEADLEYYRWRVTSLVETLETVRGLFDLYGYLYF